MTINVTVKRDNGPYDLIVHTEYKVGKVDDVRWEEVKSEQKVLKTGEEKEFTIHSDKRLVLSEE